MRGIRGLVVGAAFVLSTAAAADTITVDWKNPIFGSLGSRDVGNITYPKTPGPGTATVNTNAGMFHGTVTATTGISTAELVDSASNFYAYCHDLAQHIGDTVYTVSYGASELIRDFLGAVNAVLGGDVYAWLHPADKYEAAAIQLGIWEALHGDATFDLHGGNVSISGSPGTTTETLFGQFVAAMATSDSLSNEYVMVLTSDGKQDVITGRVPPPPLRQIPEPGTLVLFGLGALLVAGTARRRSR